MGFFRTTRKVLGRVIDIRFDRWIDLDNIKKNSNYFWDRTKHLFKAEVASREETFEEAVERLDLTPEQLVLQAARYRYLALFFLIITLLLAAYGLFLAYQGNWMGTVISFSLGSYALALAFRFHFWNFQISAQKLGCSLEEWYQNNFRKGS